jgi:hypothetical protein
MWTWSSTKLGIVFLWSVGVNSLIFAQDSRRDTSLIKASAAYLDLMGKEAALYTGAEYISPRQQIEGTPFFGQESRFKGEVMFAGTWFFSLPIHYDLVNDKLLIWSFDQSQLLVMNSEKIDRFRLGNEEFVRGGVFAKAKENRKAGFYQILYEGDVQVLAQKKKVVVQKSAADKSFAYYKQFNTYFMVMDENWEEVNGKKSIMHIFSDQKENIKAFIRNENLNYSKSPELFLQKVAAYYESIR